ncbi:MAG: hypothetical protein ACXU98_05990 [Syntrophales bacterium]
MGIPKKDDLDWFRDGFRPHFDDWVIASVDRLIKSEALIGFVFMACAIDYLAGFWWGKSTKGEVEKAYIGFVDEYFPKNKYNSKGLYDSLRNGLVHMFTIKNMKYALTHGHPELNLRVTSSGHMLLNADDFRDDLVEAKNKYFDAVEDDDVLMDKLKERYNRDGFMLPIKLTLV